MIPMSDTLAVVINGTKEIEYDRGKPLPEKQRAYLDTMDSKMDAGVTLDVVTIENPDRLERAQFVAAELLRALLQDREDIAAAMCTYLAIRLPDLRQVTANIQGELISTELVFDEQTDESKTSGVLVQFDASRTSPTKH